MNQIVIIGKTGKVKTQKVNSLTLETLYKKCKFQKSDNFEKRHTWKIQDKYFSIYSKDTGRAGHENKYELPPPVDSKLYFGTMAVVKHGNSKPSNDSLLNTNKEEWEQIYTKLMGGFEDLNSEETEEEEEEIPEEYLTKQGYSKESGFIVDDSDPPSNDKDDTEEEEEEFIDETDTDTSDKETDENDDEENDEALFGKESDYEEEGVGDEEESDEELIDSEDDNGGDSELSCEEYDY